MSPDTFSLLWNKAVIPGVQSVFSRIPQGVKDKYAMRCRVTEKWMCEKVFRFTTATVNLYAAFYSMSVAAVNSWICTRFVRVLCGL